MSKSNMFARIGLGEILTETHRQPAYSVETIQL